MKANMEPMGKKYSKRKSRGICRLNPGYNVMAVPFTEVFSWM